MYYITEITHTDDFEILMISFMYCIERVFLYTEKRNVK